MNNQYMLENLSRKKEQLEDIIRTYQQPFTQYPTKTYLEMRILNENEEVDNLYVSNKTLFLGDKNMVIKGVDGTLEKWDIVKTYPIDKKDEKISALEKEIKELKEMIKNEHTESVSTNDKFNKPNGITNVNVESKSKGNGKSISRQE